MDLGATVCTRSKPKCSLCPLQQDCVAFHHDRIDKLPSPRPRKLLPMKETILMMLMKEGRVFLEKRPLEGIWGGLWCLPEMAVGGNTMEHCRGRLGLELDSPVQVPMEPFDHTFTHFRLRIYPQLLRVSLLSSTPARDPETGIWKHLRMRSTAAIPAPVRKLLTTMRVSS